MNVSRRKSVRKAISIAGPGALGKPRRVPGTKVRTMPLPKKYARLFA